MATAGQDFGDYRQWLEAAGVDTSLVRRSREVHGVVLLQHRPGQQPDRLVLHGRHGARRGAVVPHGGGCDLAIISPNDPGAMVQYAEECRTLGIPFIFDPGQQCARMSGDELRTASAARGSSSATTTSSS
jgi:adenosine kinase